jgi:equilibrative nucleoside transporter 1/2/3
MIQLFSAWTAAKANSPKSIAPSSAFALQIEMSPNPNMQATLQLLESPVPSAAVRQTAFSFFLTIGIFAVVSWFCYAILIRLPLYRLVIRAEFDEGAQQEAQQNHSSSSSSNGKNSKDKPTASLRAVERKVRKLGIAMFLVFGITLSVFPSITSSILSVKTGHPDAKLIQQPELFVPLGFAVFAAGDWFGRVLPQWEKLAWTNWKGLMICSVARFAFVVSYRP